MTKPPELKPCPFCGGACEMWNANDERPAWIACMGRCAVKTHKTDAEAIAAWNARTSDPVVQALVEAGNRMANSIKGDYIHPGAATAWDAALAAFDKT